MDKKFYVYIVTNHRLGTLYIGITSELQRRIYEHRSESMDGFTKRYGLHRLVYYEVFDDAENAIAREKRLKEWKRRWKVELIQSLNPKWDDLWETLNN